jgi:hypothetical protein
MPLSIMVLYCCVPVIRCVCIRVGKRAGLVNVSATSYALALRVCWHCTRPAQCSYIVISRRRSDHQSCHVRSAGPVPAARCVVSPAEGGRGIEEVAGDLTSNAGQHGSQRRRRREGLTTGRGVAHSHVVAPPPHVGAKRAKYVGAKRPSKRGPPGIVSPERKLRAACPRRGPRPVPSLPQLTDALLSPVCWWWCPERLPHSKVSTIENYVTTDHQIRSLPSRQ